MFVVLYVSLLLVISGSISASGLYFCDIQTNVCRSCSHQQISAGRCTQISDVKYWRSSEDCTRETSCQSVETLQNWNNNGLQQSNDKFYYYCPGIGGNCIKCARNGIGGTICPAEINLWPTEEYCSKSHLRCANSNGDNSHNPDLIAGLEIAKLLYYCDVDSVTCRSCEQKQCRLLSMAGIRLWRKVTDCIQMENHCNSQVATSTGLLYQCPSKGLCTQCPNGNCASELTAFTTLQSCLDSNQCRADGDPFNQPQYQCGHNDQCSVCTTQCKRDRAVFKTIVECIINSPRCRGVEVDAQGSQGVISGFQCRIPGMCQSCQETSCVQDIGLFQTMDECLSSPSCRSGSSKESNIFFNYPAYQCLKQGQCSMCSGSSCVPDIAKHNTAQECQRSCGQNDDHAVYRGIRSFHYCDHESGSCVMCSTGTIGIGNCPAGTNLWKTFSQCHQAESLCRQNG